MADPESPSSTKYAADAEASADLESLDVLQILQRQRWIIIFFTLLGLAAGVTYAVYAQIWYQSTASVLINERNAGMASNTDTVDENILATHVELLRSRKIISDALSKPFVRRAVDPSLRVTRADSGLVGLLVSLVGTEEDTAADADAEPADAEPADAAADAVATTATEDQAAESSVADSGQPSVSPVDPADADAPLETIDLINLPSIVSQLGQDEDVIDYVIDHLDIEKGGEGSAKSSRTLSVTFNHIDPDDARDVLTAILLEYRGYLEAQVEEVLAGPAKKIGEAKDTVQDDLRKLNDQYIAHREAAPTLYQGEGSSNVFQDQYRRLQDEMVNLQIEQSSVKTRLKRVEETLATMEASPGQFTDHMDKLALIDSASLERLGLFAGLQSQAANSAEFKAMMPAKAEESRAKYSRMLELMSERLRLVATFGAGHPKVQDIDKEINMVQEFIDQSVQDNTTETPFGDTPMTPESLLRAYVGFLNHDLATLEEKRLELTALSDAAEQQAREMIVYELKDANLQKDIAREEELFAGIAQQLRDLKTAEGLSGYFTELLSTPRLGVKSWPSLPLCGVGGMLFGLFSGLFLAVANDISDGRFRSAAELESTVKMPSLGRVGKLNSMRHGVKGLIATELSPDAEAFRLGRTMLLPDVRSQRLKSLGVTSPMQSDGKSTCTSNLAASFGQIGLKVLVIDGDLRRPSMHNYFSLPSDQGLTEILHGELEPRDAIKQTQVENVSLITSGRSTPTPAELLQSDNLSRLLAEMEADFDLVIVDLPPVLAVSDPVVVSSRLDGTVLVVRAATARRDETLNTIRRLTNAGGKFVGCLLNTYGAGKKFSDAGGYYGYYESGYSRTPAATRTARPAERINGKVDSSV